MADLNDVIPQPMTVTLSGETLAVTPIKLGQLPRFAGAVAGIWHLFAVEGEPDYLAILTQGGEDLLDALAIALNKPRAWVDALDLAEAIQALQVVIEVNGDFFTQRVVPALTQMRAALAGRSLSNG